MAEQQSVSEKGWVREKKDPRTMIQRTLAVNRQRLAHLHEAIERVKNVSSRETVAPLTRSTADEETL